MFENFRTFTVLQGKVGGQYLLMTTVVTPIKGWRIYLGMFVELAGSNLNPNPT